jgi:hypothetical protein
MSIERIGEFPGTVSEHLRAYPYLHSHTTTLTWSPTTTTSAREHTCKLIDVFHLQTRLF